MKTQIIKLLILTVVLFLAFGTYAQTATKKTAAKTKTTKSKSKAPNSAAKSPPVAITVTLSSKCERNLMIFAGPKEKLHDPLLKEIGGLSANTFYMKTGQAICIMDARKKPVSCANITKSTSKLEINFTGTAIGPP